MESVHQGSEADGTARPAARPGAFRRLGLPAAVLSIALGATQLAAAVPSEASTASTVRVAVGHTPTLPKGAAAAAAPTASTKLSLEIELNTGHSAELAQYASGVGDKNSPYYHQYLTPSQVAQYFGASSTQISAVEAQLRSAGLSVDSVSSDRMFISASATVAQAQHAFGVTIAGYAAAGRGFYANTTAPTLPSSIAGDVANVAGLDDAAYAVPNIEASGKHVVTGGLSAGKGASPNIGATPDYAVTGCAEMEQLLSEDNLTNGVDYYSDDALSNIYGMTPVVNAGNDGGGVTVAVLELENYDPTGVAELDSCYGHSTSVSEIKVDGGPGNAAANLDTGEGEESALDIETIANLAPGVKIIDYAAPNSAAGVVADYQTMVSQNTAQVISTSWGLCEPDGESSTIQQENTIFQQAAVQGQTVVAASGDQGDTECFGHDGSSQLEVQDPSSQPFVTAVGGTTMHGLTNPSQSAWNSNWQNNGETFYGASGGGVSHDHGVPTYQELVQAPGYTANCTVAQGCRQVPDVSALADPNQGYIIDEYANDGIKGDEVGDTLGRIGGTSGAAPVWAAIFALTDATTTCRLNGEAGFADPSLYTAGEGASASSVFSDVTSGDNGIAAFGAPYSYPAAAGYDMATGWGAPKLAGIMSSLCQAPIVSPASYYVSDGPVRLMDTRPVDKIGPVTGPVAAGKTITLPVTGVQGSVPSSNLSAVVLNVTAVQPTVAGNATVYPDGSARPLASNLNWTPKETIPNLVVVPVKNGKVDIFNNSSGTINYVVDLAGYFTTDSTVTGASTYYPFGPARVADTRSNHQVGTVVGPLAAGSTTGLQVAGEQNLPASGMSAVVLNVTVTQPASSGNITVYPSGTTRPTASNVNFAANETIPNLVIVPVGADGMIDIFNNSPGTVQYVVDVAGYFMENTAGAKYHPLGPVRLLDTRYGSGMTKVGPIAAGGSLTLALPASYTAIIANLTVTAPTSNGDLDAYPAGGALPTFSNVNFNPSETIPNLAFIPSNDGVSLYNHSVGTTQALLDLAGYFSAN